MFVRTRLVALLLFGSGFCALLYQTTWIREFRLVFGASTAATAAVLGVFMSGLGFGGIILGRRSESKTRPLLFYAQLEFLIALSAALSPLLILAARHFYIFLGGTQAMGIGLGTIVRLIFAALIIGAPTFLMGGTLPAAARAAVAPDDADRRAIGVLYGTNTLGAVTGAAVGTFYCFENFGNHLSLWMAAALNVVIAFAAFRLSKSSPEFHDEKSPREDETRWRAPVNAKFVFAAAGLVGFAFFLMELVWYRMLGPLLGGSTFSFGLILATALLGIGLGGTAYARFGLKRSASLNFFALTCALEAFFIALPYALGDRIAILAMLLRPLGTIGFYGHVAAWTTLCAIVVLPAAFISGVQFPLLIALLGKGRNFVGRQTGAAYAWNTIGALVGSLAGGFGFIPMFSAPGVWKLVVVLLAAIAITAVPFSFRAKERWTRTIVPLVIVTLALVMLTAIGPTGFWRHSEIGLGRVTQFQITPNELRDLLQTYRRRVVWEKDGVESSIALTKGDDLAFVVNGKTDGSAKGDAGTQIMSGLIGAVLHPHPAKAMVVGLGTGSTAGWLAAVPQIERVDVVELEPAVLKVAERCASVNQNALRNPKVHVTIGDAREVLLTTREKYDLLVSEPSNPYRAGVAGLFTREYYQSVDRCLEPGGMFLQWVQAYDVDDRTMLIFYRTLGSVFVHIESWQTTAGDLLLLASHEPIHYDATSLRARLAEEPFKSALLKAWRATGLEDFFGHYVGGAYVAETLKHLTPGPLNTDDRTVIEFAFARSVSVINGFDIANLKATTHKAHRDVPGPVEGEVDWSRVDEGRLSTYSSVNRSVQFQSALTPDQRIRAAAFAAYMDGDLVGALRRWQVQSQEPQTLSELAMLAECLSVEGNSATQRYIDKLAEILPRDAEAIRAQYFWTSGQPREATETLDKFFRALRDDPWPAPELIKRSMRRGEVIANLDQSKTAARLLYDALSQQFCVLVNEFDRLATVLTIGMHLDGNNPGQNTLSALEAFEPHVLWQRTFLEARKTCYDSVHSARAAQAGLDFDEFTKREGSLLNDPSSIEKFKSSSSDNKNPSQ